MNILSGPEAANQSPYRGAMPGKNQNKRKQNFIDNIEMQNNSRNGNQNRLINQQNIGDHNTVGSLPNQQQHR